MDAELEALLNGPAGKPPAGIVPDFVNPPSLHTAGSATQITCLVLATVFIFMRLYTKLLLIRSMWYEDYMIIGAWVMQIGFFVVSILTDKHHGGIHMWDVRLKDFFQLLYWINVAAILYCITVLLIKLSILLQFLRIFVPHRRDDMRLFVLIQLSIWIIASFYLIITVFQIVICTPRKKIWNPMMTSGHCFNADATYDAVGVFNVVSDFLLLLLPMAPVWSLQVPPKKKILIMIFFGSGFLACVTSIFRTYYTFKISHSQDISYNILILGLWTWAEITMGIMVACLPVLPRFFQHFGPKFYSTFSFRSKLSRSSASAYNREAAPQSGYQLTDQRHQRSDRSHTWVGSHHSPSLGTSRYINLEKSGTSITAEEYGIDLPDRTTEAVKTRRADLENGV